MKRFVFLAIAALFALLTCSCTPLNPDDAGRNNNPYKSLSLTTRQAEFVTGGQAFSLSFLEQVQKESDKDFVISPLSMQFLLGMILDGARNNTADQICNTLGYGKGEVAEINKYCRAMLDQLPSLDKATKLSIANAIIVDEGWPLLSSYKKDVDKYYDAKVSNLDFSKTKESADKINKWCSDHTEGLIPKILDETDPNMLAYLLNALYFKSKWSSPFVKSLSGEENFTYAGGKVDKVKMMKAERSMDYCKSDVFEAVRLPYGNGAFSMTVLRPAKGSTVTDVINSLQKKGLDSVLGTMRERTVNLWLPTFETKFHIKLNDILSAMGMPDAFNPEAADFTKMSEYALCLSFVNQDAVIKVDEEGTEAAAISSAGMYKNTSVQMPEMPVVFHADVPFLYLITESSTGAILFAGRFGGR
ncbi:MAG: serpin family protein [Bacteroidales bacterium]|nr:serpin family protein [Bacteroidales bacterium]